MARDPNSGLKSEMVSKINAVTLRFSSRSCNRATREKAVNGEGKRRHLRSGFGARRINSFNDRAIIKTDFPPVVMPRAPNRAKLLGPRVSLASGQPGPRRGVHPQFRDLRPDLQPTRSGSQQSRKTKRSESFRIEWRIRRPCRERHE